MYKKTKLNSLFDKIFIKKTESQKSRDLQLISFIIGRFIATIDERHKNLSISVPEGTICQGHVDFTLNDERIELFFNGERIKLGDVINAPVWNILDKKTSIISLRFPKNSLIPYSKSYTLAVRNILL